MDERIKLGTPTFQIHGPHAGKVGPEPIRVCLNSPANIEVEFVHAGRHKFNLSPGDWDISEQLDKPGEPSWVGNFARMG